MAMSIFVRYVKPCLLCMITGILGKKYLDLFNNLFNLQKSDTHQTLPSFLGMMTVGNTHSLLGTCSKTPLLMRWFSHWDEQTTPHNARLCVIENETQLQYITAYDDIVPGIAAGKGT